MFIIRETFRYLRHHLGSWSMAVITLGVALGVSGLIARLAWNAHTAMAELRANLTIEAFFDPSIPSDEARSVTEAKIEALSGISHTLFISKEQALEDYTHASGENVESVLGMNPLPASVKVYLSDPSARSATALETSLRAIDGIQDVRGNFPLLHTMEVRSKALDVIAALLSSLLLLSAFFYALLAGRHSVHISGPTRRTFQLLGASKRKATMPLVLAATGAGLLAGLLAFGIDWLVKHQARAFLDASLASSLDMHHSILWILLLVCAGIMIGLLGTLIAVSTKPDVTISPP